MSNFSEAINETTNMTSSLVQKKIMVVEDDSAIMETLSIFLQYEGYKVLKARTVEQALRQIQTEKPDLVLLDYMLQNATAEPVVEALRERFQDEIVVVLLTAADDPTGKGETVGADRAIAKPFELDLLLECIQEELAGQAQKQASSDLDQSSSVLAGTTRVLERSSGGPFSSI